MTTIEEKKETNPWLAHVKAYHKSNSGMTFRQALQQAGATYVKRVAPVRVPGERKKNPWMEHIKEFKNNNPNWKQDKTYKDVLKECKTTYEKVVGPSNGS